MHGHSSLIIRINLQNAQLHRAQTRFEMSQTMQSMILCDILSLNIPVDLRLILLHLYSTDLNLRTKGYACIDFAVLQAKTNDDF